MSRILFNCSWGTAFWSSGTCFVRHTKGPIAHNRESNNTDSDPETAIWPLCSVNLCPMTDKDSPKSKPVVRVERKI